MLTILFSCTQSININLSLPDTNITSSTYGQELSLADYEGAVSAWYFGHST